ECSRRGAVITDGGRLAGSGLGMSPLVAINISLWWPLMKNPRPILSFTQTALVLYSKPHAASAWNDSCKCGAVVHKNSAAASVARSDNGKAQISFNVVVG